MNGLANCGTPIEEVWCWREGTYAKQQVKKKKARCKLQSSYVESDRKSVKKKNM